MCCDMILLCCMLYLYANLIFDNWCLLLHAILNSENVSLGCSYEQDDTWNISWPGTKVSEVSIQKCPGGSEAEGIVLYRHASTMLE